MAGRIDRRAAGIGAALPTGLLCAAPAPAATLPNADLKSSGHHVGRDQFGNLADLDSDGQSAITQRGGLQGAGCHYIGNSVFIPREDQLQFQQYAGDRTAFLALTRWVAPHADRESLRAIGAQLAAGSRSALEDDYLETAIVADLSVPADANRAGCVMTTPPPLR